MKQFFWGCLVGFLVWFYDYDFLLNAGGPNTPISDFIRNFAHVDVSADLATFLLVPMGVLILVGGLAGLIVGFIKNFFLKK